MKLLYNIITGFLYNTIENIIIELKSFIENSQGEFIESFVICLNFVKKCISLDYYIEYDDDEWHPATGRRTLINNFRDIKSTV